MTGEREDEGRSKGQLELQESLGWPRVASGHAGGYGRRGVTRPGRTARQRRALRGHGPSRLSQGRDGVWSGQ